MKLTPEHERKLRLLQEMLRPKRESEPDPQVFRELLLATNSFIAKYGGK